MKSASIALLLAAAVAGCVTTSNIDQVQSGMSQQEVVAVMGPPESSMHVAGRDCAVYTVMKDFWARVPWSMSNRYYVCYTEGKVDYFGRADQPEAAQRR